MKIEKKIRGLSLITILVLTSTPLDLFSRGGHGGGGRGGSMHSSGGGRVSGTRAGDGRSSRSAQHNHNGNRNGNRNRNWNGYRGCGYGGWGWGAFAGGLLLADSLIIWSSINSTNYNGYYRDLQTQIDDLKTQLADAKIQRQKDKIDQLQKQLDETKTQIAQLEAYKKYGYPASSDSEKTDVSKKINNMENELAALKAENTNVQ